MELSNLTNEELTKMLQEEVSYYVDDFHKLCTIIQKQIPRRMMYRIISKLYRIRTK